MRRGGEAVMWCGGVLYCTVRSSFVRSLRLVVGCPCAHYMYSLFSGTVLSHSTNSRIWLSVSSRERNHMPIHNIEVVIESF